MLSAKDITNSRYDRLPPLYYFRSRESTETGMLLMHVWNGYKKSSQSPALYGTLLQIRNVEKDF